MIPVVISLLLQSISITNPICDTACYSDVNDNIITDTCCQNEDGVSFVGFARRNSSSTYGNELILQSSPDIANIVLVKPVLVPSSGKYIFVLEILDTINEGTQIDVFALPQFTAGTAENISLLVDTIATAENYTSVPIFRIPIGSEPAKYKADATDFVRQMDELGLSDQFVAIQLVSDDTIAPTTPITGYSIAEIEILPDDSDNNSFPIWGYILIGIGGVIAILCVVWCVLKIYEV